MVRDGEAYTTVSAFERGYYDESIGHVDAPSDTARGDVLQGRGIGSEEE